MTPHAHSLFSLDTFDSEDPYTTIDGVDYARSRIDKTFRGDFEGTSEVQMLSVRAPGGAGYVAVEALRGTLGGREGTFALLHAGTMEGEAYWARWPVVPGSGTGGLLGITGEATIVIDPDGTHHLELDYEFGA